MTSREEVNALFREAARLPREESARAISLLEAAADLVDERRDVVLFARVCGALANRLCINGDTPAALARLMRVLALVSADDMRDVHHEPHAVFSIVQAHLFFVTFAAHDASVHVSRLFDVLTAAEEVLTKHGLERWRGGVLSCRASLLIGLGRVEEALKCQREAVELGGDASDGPGTTLTARRADLVRILADLGRYEEAEVVIREALADNLSHADRLTVSLELGFLLLKIGTRSDELLTVAELVVEMSLTTGLDSQCAAHGLLFEANQMAGNFQRCAEIANRHLELATQYGARNFIYAAHEDMAAAHINLGDLGQAEVYLDKAQALAQELDAATDLTRYQDIIAGLRRRLEERRRHP